VRSGWRSHHHQQQQQQQQQRLSRLQAAHGPLLASVVQQRKQHRLPVQQEEGPQQQ
jgi:hypothetical protein